MSTSTSIEPEVDHGNSKKTEVVNKFREFQSDLDGKHDKHERLVKISRDVTIESKRIIFLLHRYREGMSDTEKNKILEEGNQKMKLIQENKFHLMAIELKNEDPNQFMRAVSPGLQEYLEALSFYHYLEKGLLISLNEVQNQFVFNSSEKLESATFKVPAEEYLLGIADLSGELMRLAINNITAGKFDLSFKVCEFLQVLLSSFSLFGNTIKELNRKMTTLQQSLRKVENACYTLRVRGCEIPTHILADVIAGSGKISEQIE
ncbi:hypothetical protein LOTGIDRAFT_187846 [Lottia gigantea]|uniref:Translin-associated protein X n=1 Tax=Lottia gigantea TaxID=225164 RepID=V4ARL4_LOTGI|nr:hypothetical protein LOTGIDRAFT_187846 [Lottia gigantea]ESO97480.1 hypothetical protein LOTGIDRAFT_187846 [Lottia gigantea]